MLGKNTREFSATHIYKKNFLFVCSSSMNREDYMYLRRIVSIQTRLVKISSMKTSLPPFSLDILIPRWAFPRIKKCIKQQAVTSHSRHINVELILLKASPNEKYVYQTNDKLKFSERFSLFSRGFC